MTICYQAARVAMRLWVALLILLTTTLWEHDAWAQSKALLVANNSISRDALSKDDVRAIFLGKKSAVGKEDVVIATLAYGEIHRNFLKEVVKKNTSQYSAHWKKILFTGKGKMPQVFKTEKELLVFLSNTRGAIGYVSKAASGDPRVRNGSVRIIAVQE